MSLGVSPYENVVEIFRCKWNICILHALRRGPLRLSTLTDKVAGITAKVLTERLRRLTASGLVSRTAFPGYPLKVEYALTSRGRRLGTVLERAREKAVREAALDAVLRCKWMVAIMQHLDHARLRPRDMKRCLPGISNKILTSRLQELQRLGLIRRTVFPDSPPRVEYGATRAGSRLCLVVRLLQNDTPFPVHAGDPKRAELALHYRVQGDFSRQPPSMADELDARSSLG